MLGGTGDWSGCEVAKSIADEVKVPVCSLVQSTVATDLDLASWALESTTANLVEPPDHPSQGFKTTALATSHCCVPVSSRCPPLTPWPHL